MVANPKLTLKQRLVALGRMQSPSDRFLCRLVRKVAGNPRLAFAVNLRLDDLRRETFKRKLLEKHPQPPAPSGYPTVLDL